MGISRITALEIFTNPGDLEITIGQEAPGAKFAIGIYRGPGHNFKPLLTSEPFAETQNEAIEAVGKTLRTIHEIITNDFQETDPSQVLNPNLINRILDELRKYRKASTSQIIKSERIHMKEITWEEVLQNPAFAKGEIDIQEPGKIYRGPIKEILTRGDDVYFSLLWCAHCDICTGKWTVAEYETATIIKKSVTKVLQSEAGYLILRNPEIIVGKVFPENGEKLDPALVEGLDLSNLPKPWVV